MIDIGSNGADLFTDYTMPGMNGIELVERIKKYNPRTDAIIITADPLRISEYEGRFEVIEKTQGFIKKIIAAVYNIFKMPP